MMEEYFEGRIEKTETEEKPYRKRIGFFKYVEGFEKKHYALCSISASKDFLLRVEVEEKEFKKITAAERVSIRLKFSFEFACFHYPPDPQARKPKILEVKPERF